jgi:hypothetical protein
MSYIYLLATAWFTALVYQLPTACERQINTAINWSLWRGVIFRVPSSTPQRRKLQGDWDLIHVAAKSRALLCFKPQTQSQHPRTLTAAWFQGWELETPVPNSPHKQRITHWLEYLRQYVNDAAHVAPQQKVETDKAFKRRLYDILSYLLRETPALQAMSHAPMATN